MTRFYFNNCHPECNEKEFLSNALRISLREYIKLENKYPNEIQGVVSHETTKISFGTICLAEIVEILEVREERNHAYRIFNKFPLEAFLNIEKSLADSEDYKILLKDTLHDAFYLKIAFDNQSILFSLGICSDIRKNQLLISDSGGVELLLENLYGDDVNTKYIENIIINEINSKKDNLSLFKTLIHTPIASSKFDKAFSKASSAVQNELINTLKKVLKLQENGENVPEEIFKQNTEDENITLYYLKIRDPEAMRLYFSIIDDQYYLASLEKKPTKEGKSNEQSDHIKNARSMIRQMKKLKKK